MGSAARRGAHGALRRAIAGAERSGFLAYAIAMLATAEQQVAYMLSRNQGMKYRVLIADDHATMRQGVRALLLSDRSIEAVAAGDYGRDPVRLPVALKRGLE